MEPGDLPRAPAGTVAPPAAEPRSALRALASMSTCYWSASLVAGTVAFLLIGVPTALVVTPLFGRSVPPRWYDYAILGASSLLIGMIWAARSPAAADEELPADAADEQLGRRRSVLGGTLTFLAVGCPVCNKIALLVLGASGALAWFAPIQPVIGAAAVALLAVTLRRRLRGVGALSCAA